jgi:uncharacterized protein YdiU (UPF0061 family)
MQSLTQLAFDNRFVRELPGDASDHNTPRQVHGACYSRVSPKATAKPQLLSAAPEVAELIGLEPAAASGDTFTQVFTGNQLLPGMAPYAMCYGGHQFGNWAGQLGDGRAINLGEVTHNGQHWTLQLKGAGPTPYSRHADGLAVLRSSVREYLCSEAMHHLGVPTTRALSLSLTGDRVLRDMFYDGHPEYESGAIVCRVARSFVRFGSFEIFASRGEHKTLKQLADYTLKADFPELLAGREPSPQVYVEWFAEVAARTARTIAHWMRVGFVHGVMNTDNLAINGDTIDYGPYGWLEGYDPEWTPNTTDAQHKRYGYGAQPNIALWNLVRLANAIYPLVGEAKPLEDALKVYGQTFAQCRAADMAAKLGLAQYHDRDGELVESLLELLTLTETDMTIFFRQLAQVDITPQAEPLTEAEQLAPLMAAYYQAPSHKVITATCQWLSVYRKRTQQSLRDSGETNTDRQRRMNAVNPKYVLRNYLAQQVTERVEQGEHGAVDELLAVLRHPYDEQPEHEHYAQKRPEWARSKPGCSTLSCSS